MSRLERTNETPCMEGRKRCIILYVAVALLILGALWNAKQSGHEKDARMRQELMRQAAAVAAAVPVDEALALSFTIDDLNRPEYARLCSMLKAWSDLTGLKSIYTIKLLEDGRLVFGPETLKPDSPGDVYRQPTKEDFLPFQTGEPVVAGPFTDEYGSFVSAVAPVVHPRSGEVLFTVGIDIETPDWQAHVRREQVIPLLLVLIPLAVLFIGRVLMKWRSRTSPENARPLHYVEPAVCAVVALLLTIIITLFVAREEHTRRIDSFYSAARLKAELYASSFRDLSDDLRMLAVFFESSEMVTAEEFRSVCRPILDTHAVAGCVWIPEVPAAQRELFEANVRAANQPDFRIRPLPNADGNGSATMLYPALYVESADGKEKAFGYDLASEPVRRAALTEALQTGRITATDPVQLAALPDTPKGLFLFCPVQAASQKGALALVLRPQQLMHSLLSRTRRDGTGIQVCLIQPGSGHLPQTLACPVGRVAGGCKEHTPREIQMVFPLFEFGKPYAFLLTPDKPWIAANPLYRARLTAAAGLLLSALLTSLVTVLANRPRLLEQQVHERTAELQKSRERTELASIAAGIGIWDLDIVNDRLIWDERMVELYGLRKEDFSGAYEAWVSCLHPDDLERATADVRAAESGEKPFDTEFRIVRPDGDIRHIRAFGKVIRDKTGRPVRMTGTNQDITGTKQLQQELLESRDFLQSTLDGLTAHIALLDQTGTILLVNRAWRDFAQRNGTNPDAVCEGANYLAACRNATDKNFACGLQRVLDGEQDLFTMEYPYETAEKEYWFNACVSRFDRGGNGQAVVFHTDITERKQAEEELVQFNKAAIGRELRMVELKKEINALCRELGRETPYPLHDEA